MTQSIVRQQGAQQLEKPDEKLTLAMVCQMTGYTPLEIALVAQTVAKGAPLLELAQFVHACRALNLDPLLRQAYWIRRKNREQIEGQWKDVWKGTLQVGIDGFRSLADRQGNYAGSEPPVFRDYQEITYTRRVDGSTETVKAVVPGRAQVTCWKIVMGHKAAFTGEARWDEFYPGQTQGAMWHKMPNHQLAKCAEAQALRKGWPALLGSLALDSAGDETAEGGAAELETVAGPTVQVSERPPRPRADASVYERAIASNYPDDATQSTYVQHEEPGDEFGGDDVARTTGGVQVDPAFAALLADNRKLVAEAHAAGLKGLAPLTCNETWPPDKIAEANKKLVEKVATRNGDAAINKAQEGLI